MQPVFVSKKLEQDLRPKEVKPFIVNQQCVVNHFSCDLCDGDYICRLHNPTPSPKKPFRTLTEAHCVTDLLNKR